MQNRIGELTRIEFELLSGIYEDCREFSTNKLACELNVDEQMLITVKNTLEEQGLVDSDGITEAGLRALDPYKVQRVIIMAAGFGSRLVPITLNTPKPLVRVNGKRMIDTLLDAIHDAGIDEVIIIRGYLSEQFDQLLYKYPNIKFIENPMYNQANNISSIMCARYLLKNAYIMEADLLLSNPKLIKKYQYTSNFLGIPVESSDDWCFVVKGKDIVVQITNGNEYVDKLLPGETLYQEVGISYWDEETGCKLAHHIKEEFDKEDGKSTYWDQVPLWKYKNEYNVEIRACDKTDIVEIDSFKELVEIDKSYCVEK